MLDAGTVGAGGLGPRPEILATEALQGSVSGVNIVNLGFKHTLTPALVAVATISDVFDGQHYQRNASTPTLMQVYERSVAGRVAWFGLTYTIGVTRKEKEPSFEYDSGAVQ